MLKTQLRKARKAANKTQQECADYIGVNYSTYSGYETGKREPSVEKIRMIATFLGVSSDYLLEINTPVLQAGHVVNESSSSKRTEKSRTLKSQNNSNRENIDNSKIINLLKNKGLNYIDNRNRGGTLWVIGGHELDGIMFDLKAQGYVFSFSKKGGKATNGQAAWWYLAK